MPSRTLEERVSDWIADHTVLCFTAALIFAGIAAGLVEALAGL